MNHAAHPCFQRSLVAGRPGAENCSGRRGLSRPGAGAGSQPSLLHRCPDRAGKSAVGTGERDGVVGRLITEELLAQFDPERSGQPGAVSDPQQGNDRVDVGIVHRFAAHCGSWTSHSSTVTESISKVWALAVTCTTGLPREPNSGANMRSHGPTSGNARRVSPHLNGLPGEIEHQPQMV
jgi:hypothetical protein